MEHSDLFLSPQEWRLRQNRVHPSDDEVEDLPSMKAGGVIEVTALPDAFPKNLAIKADDRSNGVADEGEAASAAWKGEIVQDVQFQSAEGEVLPPKQKKKKRKKKRFLAKLANTASDKGTQDNTKPQAADQKARSDQPQQSRSHLPPLTVHLTDSLLPPIKESESTGELNGKAERPLRKARVLPPLAGEPKECPKCHKSDGLIVFTISGESCTNCRKLSLDESTRKTSVALHQLEIPGERRRNSTTDGPKGKHERRRSSILRGLVRTDTPRTLRTADQAAERRKMQERHKKPNWFCSFIANYPVTAFSVFLGVQCFMIILTIILYFVGYDILVSNFETVPVNLFKDTSFTGATAYHTRDQDSHIYQRVMVEVPFPIWYRGRPGEVLELIYYKQEENIFAKPYLESMQKLETALFNVPAFNLTGCMLDQNATCMPAVSILRFFDGTYVHVDPVFNDTAFQNIRTVLKTATMYEQTNNVLQYHLGKTAIIDNSTVYSEITRTFLFMGSDAQKEELEDLFYNKFVPIIKSAKRENEVSFQMFYFANYLFYMETRDQAILDMFLAVGSCIFIFIIVLVQTRSVWISGWLVFSILADFCTTNLIYRVILGYRYIGFFHILAVFILLGIGADDTFVYYDCWRLTSYYYFDTPAHRLSTVFRRAMLPMLFTSLTTMVAFLASAISDLLVLRSFGIFCGICIAVNYLSVVTFIPSAIMVHHVKFEKKCCPPSKAQKKDPESEHRQTNSLSEGPENGKGSNGTQGKPTRKLSRQQELQHAISTQEQRGNKVVQFFRGPYYRFITHVAVRWVVLIIGVGLICLFASYAAKLEPDNQQLQIYIRNTNYGHALYHRLNSFRPNDRDPYLKLYIIWGLLPQEFDNCDFKNIEDHEACRGTVQYDPSFNMNSEEAQVALLNFCGRLANISSEEIDHLAVHNTKDGVDFHCFPTALDEYLDGLSRSSLINFAPRVGQMIQQKGPMRLPMDYNYTVEFMSYFPYIYNMSQLANRDFERYFETWVTLWMTNTYSYIATEQWVQHFQSIGEYLVPNETLYARNQFYAPYNTRLAYAAIKINLTLSTTRFAYLEGLPIFERWEELLEDEKKKWPGSLQGAFLSTPDINVWHWMKVQKNLVRTSYWGLSLGICFALPVLILATMNILVGLYATITIGTTTLSVVGLIPMAGWKVDALVAINLCLVVGLSVDFVVHLAQAYCRSPHTNRAGRVKDMLEDMGVSVLCGAVTTLGAAFFMFFAKIRFYLQFAIFMFATIGFSFVYSLMLFTAMLSMFGPENNTGSLKPLLERCKAKCCKKKEKVERVDWEVGSGDERDETTLGVEENKPEKENGNVTSALQREENYGLVV